MQFRKRPVVIEAFQWTGDQNQIEDPEWAVSALESGTLFFKNAGTPDVVLCIKTLESVMTATQGDYIIKGVKGEMYPCKPEIFTLTYESVISEKPTMEVKG